MHFIHLTFLTIIWCWCIAGNIKFHSATYRLFKLGGLEGDCEDYGQAVCYRGTIPEHHVAPRTAQEGGDASSSTATAGTLIQLIARNIFMRIQS